MQSWTPREAPDFPACHGRTVSISRLDEARDGDELFTAIGGESNDALWHYIPFGPPHSAETLLAVLRVMADAQGWQTLVFREPKTRGVLGMASYMRVRPEMGSAEVGAVVFSRALQRTPAATEAIYRMARHVFDDLGYRRFEWKCDADNAASMRAARRFGFVPEGIFRQDMVVKGRNRDTAWFSMLDREWPRISSAFEAWLAVDNFDEAGTQKRTLVEIRESLV